jgi:hypothetical protein
MAILSVPQNYHPTHPNLFYSEFLKAVNKNFAGNLVSAAFYRRNRQESLISWTQILKFVQEIHAKNPLAPYPPFYNLVLEQQRTSISMPALNLSSGSQPLRGDPARFWLTQSPLDNQGKGDVF